MHKSVGALVGTLAVVVTALAGVAAAGPDPLLAAKGPMAAESHGELMSRLDGDTCRRTQALRTVEGAAEVELVFEADLAAGRLGVRLVDPRGRERSAGEIVDGRLEVGTGPLAVGTGKGETAPRTGVWRVEIDAREATGSYAIRFRGLRPEPGSTDEDGR